MNIKEAVAKLSAANVTASAEMVRRAIRKGKLKATISSRKAGYTIADADLQEYIDRYGEAIAKHRIEDPEHAYKRGYADATAAFQERFRQMALMDNWEKEVFGTRAGFRDWLNSEGYDGTKFLKEADRLIFGVRVNKPRAQITINLIGQWLYIPNTGILIDRSKYQANPENMGRDQDSYTFATEIYALLKDWCRDQQ